MGKAVPAGLEAPVTPGAQKRAKATLASRYLIPLATAMLVGVCFVIYYLTYVQQHREYLLNRNYRVLATLGEQMTETLANQTATLTSYVDAFEGGEFTDTMGQKETIERTRGGNDRTIRREDELAKNKFEMREEIRSFAPRLSHIRIDYFKDGKPPVNPDLVHRDGQWGFQLAAVDNDHDHQASAIISMQDLSLSFSPSIMDTFDDVLIAGENGRIIFQKQRIGPHYSQLSDLIKTAAPTGASQSGPDKDQKADDSSSGASGPASEHLIEMDLAGVPYIIFLEPVTVNLNPRSGAEARQARRFMLSGLVPSRRFQWQSLAISYRSVIFLSSVFLLLCLCTPVIKILFLNERERLRLREVVLLPMLFATLAGALTSICLQTTYFNFRHDDTDTELGQLAKQMQDNIKLEIHAMHRQLLAACGEADFQEDWRHPQQVIRKNVLQSEFRDSSESHSVAPYPYFGSIFLTDGQGRQKVKWSPMKVATPLVDVSRLEFFRHLESENHYFFLEESEPFRLDSVLPPNQDNYVGVIGMRLSDCPGYAPDGKGFAFLSAPLLSLIDPKLPLGFGFALVDGVGNVLFHSDKYRNNRENFLVETRNDAELTASIYGHSNQDSFSVDYRGSEVRARVVPVPGINQSSWSLIVYKDVLYAQTYDLEIITMSGTLLFAYLAVPALIVFFFYLLARPTYVPEWLWPSTSAARIYRFQIEIATAMLLFSAALSFTRPVEESLYAAAAAGYVTLIMVSWSALYGKPPSRGRTIFGFICGLAAISIVAFPIWLRWWWCVPIGLVLLPFILAVRGRRHLVAARWRFPQLSYRHLYNIRAFVLLTVVGILPSLSFFRNSMILEDYLHIRAAQLHAATAWNERERTIERLDKEVPESSAILVWAGADGELANRCRAAWDFYLSSYFETEAAREPHSDAPPQRSDYFDAGFLRFAHSLHHSYNNIGAEALGVLRNPALPENVYVPGSPEWEWDWDQRDERPLKLRLHDGADQSNTCAADYPGAPLKRDLVISSAPPSNRISAAYLFTWLAVTVAMSSLFWLVTKRIFLFDLVEPLSHSPEELREILKGAGNVLVLPAPRNAWSPELAGANAVRIDVRDLAAGADWGERLDLAGLPAEAPVIIENFDWELSYPRSNRQRLMLMEWLIADSRKVIAVSAVDPSPFIIDHCSPEGGPETESDAARWAAVLGAFKRVNLGHQLPWDLDTQTKEGLPVLWQECSAQPELYRVGADLWHSHNPHQPLQPEQVVSEVGESAAQYYYLEWRSCTQEECFLLTGLARDGMVNPKNVASLRQLLRRRLVVKKPQFRMMNESFRRFVLAQASLSMRETWEAEAAGSGWGKARGPFATVVVLVGLFLLATQQQFLQTSAGVLTAAGGGLAALLKLVGMVQGKNADQ